MKKLLSIDARKSLVSQICSVLYSRRQSVKLDGFHSDWAFINGGVPQLSTILNCDANLWKYVDDITICGTLYT